MSSILSAGVWINSLSAHFWECVFIVGLVCRVHAKGQFGEDMGEFLSWNNGVQMHTDSYKGNFNWLFFDLIFIGE